MSLRKSALAAFIAASVVAVPAVANDANQLSVRSAPAVQKSVRARAAKRDASNVGGGSVIIAILAAAAVIAGIVVAADGGSSPSSP
jgi:hypothetical protein